MGTAYLIICTVTNIFAIITTTYYYWRLKDMETTKNHYKGCTELYREFHKQDLNENAVEDYEQHLKEMFESFKKK